MPYSSVRVGAVYVAARTAVIVVTDVAATAARALAVPPAAVVAVPPMSVIIGFGLSLGVLGAEGVGDALAGGVGLPIDAVRVDLQQDGNAVPGAASDLGGGLRESWRLTPCASRLVDRRPER